MGHGDGLLSHGGSRRKWADRRRRATALESKATRKKMEEEEQWACARGWAKGREEGPRDAGVKEKARREKTMGQKQGLLNFFSNLIFLILFQMGFKFI